MTEDPLVSAIRRRAGLASEAEAAKALEATLTCLFERIAPPLATKLQSVLPHSAPAVPAEGKLFSFDEFCQRLADASGADVPVAVFRARSVLLELREVPAVAQVLEEVAGQLTPDFAPLFWQPAASAATAA